MSGVNQAPPPSPSSLPPLRQAVQNVKSGQQQTAAPAPNPAPAPAPQPAPQQTAAPKIRKPNGIIPDSMKKNIAATQQAQPAAPQPAPAQPVANHLPVVPPPQAQPPAPTPSQPLVDAPTYYEGGDNNSGFIEFDLQSYRQRGVEERFLSISVLGLIEDIDIEDKEIANQVVNQVSRTTMRIADRAQFEALKTFFANLEWEG